MKRFIECHLNEEKRDAVKISVTFYADNISEILQFKYIQKT